MKKEAIKLKSLESFNHDIRGRKIKIAFKLDGEIGTGLTEAGLAIKHPDDEDDEKFADEMIAERISEKTDEMHYGVLNDADILNWAARGMAYEAANRIEKREREAELKEIMEHVMEVEKVEETVPDFADVLSSWWGFPKISDLEKPVVENAPAFEIMDFEGNSLFRVDSPEVKPMSRGAMVEILSPGFPFNEDCEDCEHILDCMEEYGKQKAE